MARTAHIRPDDADRGEQASRRPGRPRDPGYDKTILDAALAILMEKGYAGLTIDGVAARTGVGRPTIYRRWASKPELVIAALAEGIGLSPTPDTGVLREDLLAFARDQIRMMNAPQSRRVTAGLVADLVADPDLAETYFSEYVEPRRSTVWQALERGIQRGELRSDADFSLIYDLVMGPLFMRAVVRGERLQPDMAERIVDLVMAAFGTGSTTPRKRSGRGSTARRYSSPR